MFLKFKMKTKKVVLKFNALLLADVFEKIRNKSLKNDRLYLIHYLSAPC